MQISWRPLRPLVAPVLRSTDPSRRARRRLLPPARTCRGNGCARCHDDLKRWSSHPSHPFSTVVDVLWTSLDQEAGLGLSEAQRLWDECAGLLRAQVSEPVWLTQFDDARAVALTDDTLTVAVTSFLAKERIEGRYLSLVRDALNEIGAANIELVLEVAAPRAEPEWTVRPPRSEGGAVAQGWVSQVWYRWDAV